MERRLVSVELKYNEISKERSNHSWSETETSRLLSSSRQKRNADPKNSLSDLTKRLIALEESLVRKTDGTGRDGRDGVPGPRGVGGDTGRTGSTGSKGSPGSQGAKGRDGQGLSGVSYNRWGRKNCSGDATLVYTGYMGGGYYTHIGGGTNEYVCVDEGAEAVDGGHSDTDGALLYVVEGSCSHALPCGPYRDTHELTCVVCTK
ncbi:hypothetical protein AWC38_SpisGene19926 [Stylophora pistillata]|uniref:Short-chain collagen C4 n=1 Tax=Stylophora pistillata TaxID=50429 RepID=A0A2B4RG67_STYPI|nr:hypothetical protein AWC38_SpisGene19926 [Stylophora pistillata]